MESLKDCSTMPVFEGEFEPPLEKGTYTMDKCQFSTDGFPNHLQEGFYKVQIIGKGEIAFELNIVCKVEKAT